MVRKSYADELLLARVDLNVLVALNILLHEKSVTKAAEKLFVTQSAMSKTLFRLREMFADPLLIRTGNDMQLTVKAIELREQLPSLMTSLANIISNQAFDPSTCDRTFSISIPPSMNHSLLIPLIKEVKQSAPNIKLMEYPITNNPYDIFTDHEIDFAIHIANEAHPDYTVTSCGKCGLSVFARKGHPITKLNQIGYQDCLEYQFIALNYGGNQNVTTDSVVHAVFSDATYRSQIAVTTSQPLIVNELLKSSDYLYIGPDLFTSSVGNQALETVFQFDIGRLKKESSEDALSLYLIEPNRVSNSPAHQWFRNVLERVMRGEL